MGALWYAFVLFLVLGTYLTVPWLYLLGVVTKMVLGLQRKGRSGKAIDQALEEMEMEDVGFDKLVLPASFWVLLLTWPLYWSGILRVLERLEVVLEERTRPFKLHLPPRRR